jgi:hypothetical protein
MRGCTYPETVVTRPPGARHYRYQFLVRFNAWQRRSARDASGCKSGRLAGHGQRQLSGADVRLDK